MRLPLYGVVMALLSAGCMQAKALPHMNELLTLKAYSDERDDQSKWVESEDARFGLILTAAQDGSLKNYYDQNAVTTQFGPPVLEETIEEDGQPVKRWLYRHPIQKLATDRVYLYFTADGRLRNFEHQSKS